MTSTARLRSVAGMILALLTLALHGTAPARAEYDPDRHGNYQGYQGPRVVPAPRRARTPQAQQYYYAPQPRYYYAPPQPTYAPRPAYIPQPGYVPQWGPGFRQSAPPTERFYEERPRQERVQRRRREREEPREVVRRRAPAPAAVARPAEPKAEASKPEEPEIEPTTTIAVYGDSLAQHLGDGLDEVFEEVAEVEIDSRAKGNTGLVREDVHDWAKTIEEHLKSGERVSLAVVMVGVNDRQGIREGDTTHEFLSPRWREIYGARVDAVIRPLAARKVPFLWVGAPPLKNEKASADVTSLNDIYRERVQRAGGTYVDIWPGFVDDENHYAASGPDISGQVARLRAADGIHFTRAGARKAAHFANVEIKRILDRGKEGAAVAALPPANAPADPGAQAPDPAAREAAVERLIDASVPDLPPIPGLAAPPPRPVAGPVVPLTRPELSPGGVLVAGRPAASNDVRLMNERILVEGVAAAPRPGRADDFTWPARR